MTFRSPFRSFQTSLGCFRSSLRSVRTSFESFRFPFGSFRTSLGSSHSPFAPFRTSLRFFRASLASFRTSLVSFRTSLGSFRTSLVSFRASVSFVGSRGSFLATSASPAPLLGFLVAFVLFRITFGFRRRWFGTFRKPSAGARFDGRWQRDLCDDRRILAQRQRDGGRRTSAETRNRNSSKVSTRNSEIHQKFSLPDSCSQFPKK